MAATVKQGLKVALTSVQRPLYGSPDKPPIFLQLRSSKIFILTAICFVIFTDIFMYGVLVPVLPFALTTRVGIDPKNIQHWVSILLAVYGAALFVAAPITGWVGDRSHSRRLPFMGGILVLAGATLMLCLGRNVGILIAGRILQGVSASVVWVVGLTIVADTFGKTEAGEVMGYIAIAYTLGVLTAPLLGGVVYGQAGYYAVFAMAFAMIGVDAFLRVILIETGQARKWNSSVDVAERATSEGNDKERRQDAPVVEAQELKTREEMQSGSSFPARRKAKLPPILLLLKSRRMLTAWWGTFVAGVLYASFDTTLPLYVHRKFGWDSTGGGLIFLTVSIPSLLGPIIGRYSDKHGPRWIAATGYVAVLPFYVLMRLVNHDSIGQKVLLCALLVLIGLALALTISPIMAEFIVIVEAKERQQPGLFGAAGAYAQAYGLFNTAWAAGYLIGPVWAGYVESKAGWGTMTWSLGVFSALSALPVIFYTGGLITRRKADS